MNRQNYDWEAHCQSLGLSEEELHQVAESERLSMRSLSPKQSEKLLKALKKYAKKKNSDAIAQQSLF